MSEIGSAAIKESPSFEQEHRARPGMPGTSLLLPVGESVIDPVHEL